MTCYVSLPIACFYLFNKPEYFKELLTENKRYYFINEDPKIVNAQSLYKYQPSLAKSKLYIIH